MTKVKKLHRRWLKDPKYRTEYEALEDEFHLIRDSVATAVDAPRPTETIRNSSAQGPVGFPLARCSRSHDNAASRVVRRPT